MTTTATSSLAALAAAQGTSARGATTLRALSLDAPPARPRSVSSSTAEDRVIALGSVASAAALGWLICYRLLPWGSVLACVLISLVLLLLFVTVATVMTTPGPAVPDRLVTTAVTAGAAVVGFALASTIVFVLVRAWPALWHVAMWTDDMAGVGPRDDLDTGGVLHAIVGSLVEVGIALAIAVPLAIGTAVFMTEVGGRLGRIVRTVVEAMTALPSIVAGLFIYTVLIVALGMPRSGLAAGFALTVMSLPIMARAAEVVLRVMPGGLREASLALGASRLRTVWHVVLPTARPGLATAIILGLARAVGETSPVLLTSGAAPFLVTDPTTGVMNSLPLFVFSSVRSGEPLLEQRGFAAAAVLLVVVLVLFVVARWLARASARRS